MAELDQRLILLIPATGPGFVEPETPMPDPPAPDPPTPDPTPDPPTPPPPPAGTIRPDIDPPTGWNRHLASITYRQTAGGQRFIVPRWKITRYTGGRRMYTVAPFDEQDNPIVNSPGGFLSGSIEANNYSAPTVRLADPRDDTNETVYTDWTLIGTNPQATYPFVDTSPNLVLARRVDVLGITEDERTFANVYFKEPPPPSPYADGGEPPTGWSRSLSAVTYQRTDGTRVPVPRWKLTASNGMRNGYKVAPFGADNEPILRTAGGFMGPNSIQISGFPSSVLVRLGDPNRTDLHFQGGLFSFEFVRTDRNQAEPTDSHPWFHLINKDYNVSMLNDNQPPGQSELATLITEDPMSYMDLYFHF